MMKTINTARTAAGYQQGFTLVEIMVSVTISLLLLAGVMQIFISSKASYNLQSGISHLHENARFATDVLIQNVGMAGFNTDTPIISATTQDNVTANASLGFTIATGTASDTITVQYQSTIDCLGNPVGGGMAENRYYLGGTDGTDLMCLGNGTPGTTNPGILAEGIENMQILYGRDDDGDDIANRYVIATNMGPVEDVVSIRFALLVNSIDTVGGANDTRLYSLLNAPPMGPISNNRLRRVFTRTIILRNQALNL